MSFIKPSHRGLLHAELGVPQGEKIGRAKLEAAAHASDPVERKRAQFAINMNDNGTHGVVSEMSMHSNGKHAMLDIVHGRKSPLTAAEKKEERKRGYPMTDDRPRSRVAIPKERAHLYHVGMKVGVGAIPLEGPNTDEMDGDGDDPLEAKDRMTRSIITGGKRKG